MRISFDDFAGEKTTRKVRKYRIVKQQGTDGLFATRESGDGPS